MEVKITEEKTYTVEIHGKKHPGFRKVSEWNGMMELRNAKGEKLIVETEGVVASVFRGITSSEAFTASVIKASPGLL